MYRQSSRNAPPIKLMRLLNANDNKGAGMRLLKYYQTNIAQL